tara:strand:- start:456 stop:1700 length:1245 start_codon:yes stop_codon:yes gene_type:complete
LVLSDFEQIKVLVPRSICNVSENIDLFVNDDGLTPLEITWGKGIVTNIEALDINELDEVKGILFPRFVEAHAHFDKSFSWNNFPNLRSDYENALSVNLEEHITRTPKTVIKRAKKSLEYAINNGYRAIRTHVDTYLSQDDQIWNEIFNLRKEYTDLLELQFVALAPLEFWGTLNGEILAKKLTKNNGLLGGVLVPPFNKKSINSSLSNLLELAMRFNLGVDLHVDESSIQPGRGINLLLKTIDKLNCQIPITCSHSSSILLLKNKEIYKIGERIAEKNIKVIALPLTNFWLLNRDQHHNSLQRPVAPIKQLQKSFVDVSIGSDNVQDPWYPFGNFDPFYLMSHAMPMLQINPWDRLSLSAILNAPSRLLNLNWDGVISLGCPADFVVVEGNNWGDIFSNNLKRKVFIKGNWYQK